jgi:hypothetical protein
MKNTKYDKKWLQKEFLKDDLELEKYKKDMIESIRSLKKEQIFEEKKLTLWMKIKRTLGL